MTRQTKMISALVAVVALVAAGAGGYLYTKSKPTDSFASCGGSQIAGGAKIGGPFTLLDARTGKTVTDAQVITKPSLVYFGYTFCPDVCPLDNARNAQATDILAKMGMDVQPVFISVDPARDTPRVVNDFTEAFSPKMIGLTGTLEQVKAAAKEYKAFFRIADPSKNDYIVDHSTFTYLMLPKTGFADFFKREDTPEQVAKRVACYLNAQNAN